MRKKIVIAATIGSIIEIAEPIVEAGVFHSAGDDFCPLERCAWSPVARKSMSNW
jgi:hypothetical protein